MKRLVLTSEPISAEQLRDVVGDEVSPDEVQVMVVVPALHDSALEFWLSDDDNAIARSDEVMRATVQQLGEAGIHASSDTGESDPREALADALSTFRADRVVLFAHPESERRYREDVDVDEVAVLAVAPLSDRGPGAVCAVRRRVGQSRTPTQED